MSIESQLRSYDELNEMQVAAIQSESSTQLDFSQGSVNLAYVQSNSGIALMLQSIAVYLYSFARASTLVNADPTDINPDLDSFINQFSQNPEDAFNRLPAVASEGDVTFSRYDTSQQAVIPASTSADNTTQVETTIGNIIYNVIVDKANPNWNDALQGYVIPVNTASIYVPAQAAVAGSSGNVAANQINTLVQGIPYVNNVNNPQAFTNGRDTESDSAFLARFQQVINSLSKATPLAVEAAIESVRTGILYNVLGNKNYSLQPQPGFITVVIDDGSGEPPSSLLSAVESILEKTVALAVLFGVYATTPITENISATLLIDPTYDETLIHDAVVEALTKYINNLNPGEPLYYSKIPNIIYLVSPGIWNVNNLLVNGSANDIIPTGIQSVKIGTVTLNFS